MARVGRAAAGVAAALVLGAVAAACGGGAPADEPRPVAANAPDARRAGSGGVTVALPPGWHAAVPDDGRIVDPVTRVAVASGPIAPARSPCQVTGYAFAPEDVALVVLEWASPAPERTRPASFTPAELPVRPHELECHDGPGGAAFFADAGRTFGAYLVVGRRAGPETIAAARRVLDSLEVAPNRLVRAGVSLDVPRGWHGRILFTDPAGASGLVFQAATFRLPANEGLEPPPELPLGEEDPIASMHRSDVLATVLTDAPGGVAAPARIRLEDLRLLPRGAPRVPRGHALAEGTFCFGSRCVRIEVDFGGDPPPARRVAEVERVLASLAVDPAG